MKKHILLIIAILFLPLIVVGDDCYTRTRQKAIDAYNRGEYDYAKGLFQSAKEDCIETPTNNDIDSWINKCSSAKREQTKLKQQSVSKTTQMGTHNGHDYVDLGLSVKWATCNVGAPKPEQYGAYFAWGEVEPKGAYSWKTYKHAVYDINGFSDYRIIKYCEKDNKIVLDPEDDAATINWGGKWRMPTKNEQNELFVKCKWVWTTLNGVNGYRVIGPNGNSIFLSAAGYIREGTLNEAGSFGYYWSNSLYSNIPDHAYIVYFKSSFVLRYEFIRTDGRSVRPVFK